MNTPTPEDARAAFAQWTEALRQNRYEADPHLGSILRRYGRQGAEQGLRAFGQVCAEELDPLVRENNRDENLPRLQRYDGQGRRIEAVDFHPTYHQIGRKAYGTGLLSLYGQPGRELQTLAYLYLLGQDGEAGHCCPIACTAGMIKILQADGTAPEAWLQRLLDPDYDQHFHAAQFLTEVQGGSDVGANAVVAHQGPDGWRLHGEKWFCSVIDAHLFLVTARPEGAPDGTRGVMAFAVPRHLPDGRVNDFQIRRLKYKLGTRSMASAEMDLQGAWAHPVGDFRRTMELVLNTSRLYNAACSSAFLQRAYREAHAYAAARMAFGQPILAFPTVARIVARLRTEAYAARGLTFFLADLSDRLATGAASDRDAAAFRFLVNLNKFWTSHAGTTGVRDAIEIFGGNGAIEEFTVLPRLLRDSVVCEAWEGGHNVLCAQALRDSARLGLHEAAFDLLAELSDGAPSTDDARARWERLLSLPAEQAATHVRDVAEAIRPAVQAAVLLAEARHPGSDPLLPVVIEHLLTTRAPGYDPLADEGLAARVRALVG